MKYEAPTATPSLRRVLVTGSRDHKDVELIEQALYAELPLSRIGRITIVHGAAAGADTIAGKWATDNCMPQWVFPADWNSYGKPAGMIRNQDMLTHARPQVVLAFPLPQSRGTYGMMKIAEKAGVEVKIFQR